MKASHKPKLNQLLRLASPPPERPADDFWADFQARARLVPQTAERTSAPAIAHWRFAAALAAMALVLFAALQFWPATGGSGTRMAATPPAGQTETLSRIEEVQIFLDHSSVTILEDSVNGGTVVFVETLPPPNRT